MQVNNIPHTAVLSKPFDNSDSLEARKQKLYQASKDLESIFLYHMLQTMRKTVPDNSDSGGVAGTGFGEDVYMQMFDQELASKMAGTGKRSLADMLYSSLEKILEKQSGIIPETKAVNTLIEPVRKPINLKIKNITSENNKPDKLNLPQKNRSVNDFEPIIRKAARKYDLDPKLLESVIKAESGGDPAAVSPAGAKGLMQLMDTTAEEVGVRDIFDPEENILGGARYLRQMLNRFGDIRTALAAYNAGPGTVEKYGGVPPYKETRDYINKILGRPKTETAELIVAAKENI